MWDDFSPFLAGTGPTATVLDPDGTPNHILDFPMGGSVQVDWSFSGMATNILPALRFAVSLYADPVGPGANTLVGGAPVTVLGSATLPSPPNPPWSYRATIPIAPSSLPVGAYRLTTLITTVVTATNGSVPIAGFIDGPIIQVRPGP